MTIRRFGKIRKLIVVLNYFFAIVLLLSFILPYVPPKQFAVLSVLSLGVPFLIIINVVFLIYWTLKLRKQLWVSLIVLLIGYYHVASLYKFPSDEPIVAYENTFTVMNYNVRLFNLFNWIPKDSVKKNIFSFIYSKQPDVICMQEYHQNKETTLEGYFKYEILSGGKVKNGQAIYSKYPIINKGSIPFPNTNNNAIFIDIVKQGDTTRIYNLHLQSSKINPSVENLKKEDSQHLFNRVSATFKKQQFQSEIFLKHKQACPFKMIICGDFNNTAYSYVYKQIKGNLKDAFTEAGKGFGSTYNFKLFPMRIDFILTDPSFKVNNFETYTIELSDHYPIMASLKI